MQVARCTALSRPRVACRPRVAVVRAAVGTGNKIVVVSNPSQERIEAAKRWPTWGCGAEKFPWSYTDSETCYVLEGRVIVTPDGGEGVEIKQGDMATFPAGMSCVWDVKEPIRKHYNFH